MGFDQASYQNYLRAVAQMESQFGPAWMNKDIYDTGPGTAYQEAAPYKLMNPASTGRWMSIDTGPADQESGTPHNFQRQLVPWGTTPDASMGYWNGERDSQPAQWESVYGSGKSNMPGWDRNAYGNIEDYYSDPNDLNKITGTLPGGGDVQSYLNQIKAFQGNYAPVSSTASPGGSWLTPVTGLGAVLGAAGLGAAFGGAGGAGGGSLSGGAMPFDFLSANDAVTGGIPSILGGGTASSFDPFLLNDPLIGVTGATAPTGGNWWDSFVGNGGSDFSSVPGGGLNGSAAPGSGLNIPSGAQSAVQNLIKQLLGGGSPTTGQAQGGFGGAAGSQMPLAAIIAGLASLFGNNQIDPSKADALYGAGQNTYNLARDPQNALYDRSRQRATDASRAAQSARGIAMSPFGAGLEADALKNFDIDWNNNLLNRNVAGTNAFSDAARTSFGQSNTDRTFDTNQTSAGTSALLSGLSGLGPFIQTLFQ